MASSGEEPGHEAEAGRAKLLRNNSRQAVVRRQKEQLLLELQREDERAHAELGASKMPITVDVTRTSKDGSYVVEESATHVTKLRKSEVNQGPLMVFFKDLFAGGGAGAITKTAVAPLERTKILLQVQGMNMKTFDKSQLKYRGVLGTMRTVFREEGFRALYHGNGANVLRVIPVYALKFSFNSTFKDMVRTPGEDLTFLQLIAAGTMAGLFQTCVTYPLETVRTRLTLGAGMGVKYNGILDVFRRTVQQEGFAGLYKGIGPTFLSGSPYVGLQMTFYEIFKRNLERRGSTDKGSMQKQIERLSAGACAGVIAQTLTYPGDTIRRRMQMNGVGGAPKVYTSSFDCCKRIVATEGVPGLFNGLLANLVRAVPGAAIQFWAFDVLSGIAKEW